MHRYIKVSDLIAQMHIEDTFLRMLEDQELIHPKRSLEGELVISSEDAERVRVVRLLTAELDVNLAGVEVIIHMRDTMMAMQKQFSEILDAVVEEIRRRNPSR